TGGDTSYLARMTRYYGHVSLTSRSKGRRVHSVNKVDGVNRKFGRGPRLCSWDDYTTHTTPHCHTTRHGRLHHTHRTALAHISQWKTTPTHHTTLAHISPWKTTPHTPHRTATQLAMEDYTTHTAPHWHTSHNGRLHHTPHHTGTHLTMEDYTTHTTPHWHTSHHGRLHHTQHTTLAHI
ncbi:hypothetical protein Bbelb_373870, partial [Branchiostoma belcheri]